MVVYPGVKLIVSGAVIILFGLRSLWIETRMIKTSQDKLAHLRAKFPPGFEAGSDDQLGLIRTIKHQKWMCAIMNLPLIPFGIWLIISGIQML